MKKEEKTLAANVIAFREHTSLVLYFFLANL